MIAQQKEELFSPEIIKKISKNLFQFQLFCIKIKTVLKDMNFYYLTRKSGILRTRESRKVIKTKKLQKYQEIRRRNFGVKISLKTSFPAILILAASL